MSSFQAKLLEGNVVIGMVHLKSLPGSTGFDGDIQSIYDQALQDTNALKNGGVTAVLIENFNDQPFLRQVTLEQKVTMASVCSYIKNHVNIAIGIDVAFNDYETSLAIANAINADFIRVPAFVDNVANASGNYEPVCANALKYRKQLNATHISILADIQVKETIMVYPEVPLENSAILAEKYGADAVIVTGTQTGTETPMEFIENVKKIVNIPVLAGSGVNRDNISDQLRIANGVIVGSSIKRLPEKDKIAEERVIDLMNQVKETIK